MKKIRILLVDFQFLTREGIVCVIDRVPQLELAGICPSYSELTRYIIKEKPDVIIADAHEFTQQAVNELSRLELSDRNKTLLFVDPKDQKNLDLFLSSGIHAMLTKSCTEEEIHSAILAAANNEHFYCKKVTKELINSAWNVPTSQNISSLSGREKEVVDMIIRGQTTASIADALHVSIHTINSHRKSILKKLNLKSPAELIVYAMETKWIR